MKGGNVLVLAAFRAELPLGLAGRDDVAMSVCGAGSRAAGIADRLRAHAGPVLVVGSCGALTGDVSVGTLACPDAVKNEDGRILRPSERLRAALIEGASRAWVPLHEGVLAQVPAVVDDDRYRADLSARTGASVADTESARLGAAAVAAGCPWAVLRFVTDAPGVPLGWLSSVLGGWPEGDLPAWRIAAGLARRPQHVGRMVALGMRVFRGRRATGKVIRAALG